MKHFIVLSLLLLLNCSLTTMEQPKTESTVVVTTPTNIQNSTSEAQLICPNTQLFKLDPELLRGLDDQQVNLRKIMDLADHIRINLLQPAKPLLYAWHHQKLAEIDTKKEECLSLAIALNKASNLLEVRLMKLSPELRDNQAFGRLRTNVTLITRFLETDRPYNFYIFAQKHIDHPANELNTAFCSTQSLAIQYHS